MVSPPVLKRWDVRAEAGYVLHHLQAGLCCQQAGRVWIRAQVYIHVARTRCGFE